jgi:hypothetical protein
MRSGVLLVLALAGCSDLQLGGPIATDVPEAEGDIAADETDAYTPATRADLRTKRWRQLTLDLQQALQLPEDELCREAGLYQCTDLHVVPLGGVSLDNGLYQPVDGIAVTTGLATERVALAACWERLSRDRAAEAPALVFTELDLTAAAASDRELDAQAALLWRRFLARDATADELAAARSLHAGVVEDGGGNAEWGLALCAALATSSEFLLY